MAALTDPVSKILTYAVRHQKFGVFWPAIGAFGKADFIFSQGFSVGFPRVLFIGSAVSDVAVHDDEGGTVMSVMERIQRTHEEPEVICVTDAGNVPAISHE